MRKVKLRMNEHEKYKVIKELVDHNGNKQRASIKLNLSRRQIDRLIAKYKENGKSSFVHGNRGKVPMKALDKSISEDIILLYKNKYQDFNFNHFKEYLEEEQNIHVSYNFIHTTLMKENILSPKARKVTRKRFKKEKLIKEKKLENKTEKEIEVIVKREIDLEDAHPRGEKPKYFGEVIEMDASEHQWFGSFKTHLHLAIDKATSTVVGGYFQNQETLKGYYNVFSQILISYGIPYSFLTDNRTVFNYISLNPDKRTSDKDVLTQFGYACKTFGTDLKTTSVSQAKGLIERTNGTFQGRLINELKLNGITSIDEANKYLNNVFIPKFNAKFAMDYTKFDSVFEKSPSLEKINYTLAVLTARKIDNGNAIKYKNKYYQPYLNNEIKCFLPKTEVLVIEAFDNNLLVTIEEKVYSLKELDRNERFSKNIDIDKIIEKKEAIKYIPPMSHPWKVNSFKQQLKNAHNNKIYT